ncbi:PP2C family protein-serine/threonine phosphatase [Methylovulum miyakonense]|uniref:PP2C family protein-serine/threonine phosphatase n=1 Tax=Methylovulum miyakonense TaxID=645578 RepID=UPI0003A3ADD1|nr:SpoIIE family protein phosphatase [Methylovulum miyakonense]
MMRILIVEDNLLTRLMMERSLKKWGYEVVAVDNIDAAIRIILEDKIQFVITDWIMPGGNGIELCQQVRALNLPCYTYIILVTYLDDAQSIVQGMDAGADDFIRKPIQLDELLARIRAGQRVLDLERKLQENNLRLTETSDKLLAAHELINRDLKMAATMQRSLLPSAAAQGQGATIDWLFHPSTYLSGDIFNFFPLDEHHVAFYILDVAGHGIAAAMQSFTLSRILSPDTNTGHLTYSVPEDPGTLLVRPAHSVVANLNQQFQTNTANILYFTMVYGVIDTLAQTIELCQAGHPHPLYLQAHKPAEFIINGGLPVGIIGQASYGSLLLNYHSGDRLFLYSDGITECESPTGEMFGIERLRLFVEQTRELAMRDVIRELDGQIRSWRGGDGFEDDISMLILEIN